MRVVVLQGAEHHTEDDTAQDTSTSWVNEILQAHTLTQFIHLRAIISSNVVFQAVTRSRTKNCDMFCDGYCCMQQSAVCWC